MFEKNGQEKLVEDLQIKQLIRSTAVARAMSAVDRADFTDFFPYIDSKSPIGYRSHIEAPNVHAQLLVKSDYCLTILGDFEGAFEGEDPSTGYRLWIGLFHDPDGKADG